MITRNGAIAISSLIGNANIGINALVLLDGSLNENQIIASNLYLQDANINDNQRGLKMRLGLGDAEPAADDHQLAQTQADGVDVNSVITCQSASKAIMAGGGIVYTYTFKNTSLVSAYTIKEVGMIDSAVMSGSPSFLFARQLIPPRTIQPGEIATFSYALEF